MLTSNIHDSLTTLGPGISFFSKRIAFVAYDLYKEIKTIPHKDWRRNRFTRLRKGKQDGK